MVKPRTGWVRGVTSASPLFLAAACGGSPKQAAAPSTCPDGTMLRGSDCVPSEESKDRATAQDRAIESTPPATLPANDENATANARAPAQAQPGGKTPYDKDAVEVELKRGARQVKANCGAATDEDGQARGPWGKTKAAITLGRNGHVKEVTVPAPYDGKPVGLCIARSFDKIQFPPYAADSDAVVEWDVEIVRPKGRQ